MDNKQKLEFILKLERRARLKRIIIGIIIVLLMGAAIVYLQVKGMDNQMK